MLERCSFNALEEVYSGYFHSIIDMTSTIEILPNRALLLVRCKLQDLISDTLLRSGVRRVCLPKSFFFMDTRSPFVSNTPVVMSATRNCVVNKVSSLLSSCDWKSRIIAIQSPTSMMVTMTVTCLIITRMKTPSVSLSPHDIVWHGFGLCLQGTPSAPNVVICFYPTSSALDMLNCSTFATMLENKWPIRCLMPMVFIMKLETPH